MKYYKNNNELKTHVPYTMVIKLIFDQVNHWTISVINNHLQIHAESEE